MAWHRGSAPTTSVAAALAGLVATSCGTSDPAPPAGGSGSSGTAGGAATTQPMPGSSSTGGNADGDSSGAGGASSGTGAPSTDSGGESSTGPAVATGGSSSSGGPPCAKNVVLMGYWPPTNEMLRAWSQNAAQNPDGWQGADWGGHGFDVYAFFPEFPPDGDPANDPIGSVGSVGSAESDLRVDYQDTSEDFWAIVDALQPLIVITTSRGGGIGWEIEAIEGGHGGGAQDPSLDWTSDGFGAAVRPTEATVDPRSWDAISTYRGGATLGSLLPMKAIEDATDALGLASVAIDTTGTSGNYLSGFLGLHGIYYAETTDHAVAGGHIHVANGLPTETATTLMEATLTVVLETMSAETLDCPPR
ncbi:MAG: hypothetical protein AAF721_08525 [Myxococcota bacterium]